MPLTDVQVRNAKASAAPYKLTDGNGMFLLVQPNGAKYWRLSYRFLGKQKTLALGVYGRPLECGQLDVCLSRLLHRKRPSSTVVQVVDRGAPQRYRMGSTRAVGGSDGATFHGSSSSTRLAGWSAMRSST
ncbi:hypothetical protein DO71_4610 [Burkholderia pseudomallei]|nr:hypothetical protein DO71_4610 [Burkholderia pseudomallei]KGV12292.1 hypothetical protein X891_2991 [Burkholderia pseudomallei TSV 43]KGV42277.1 hypothetical protein X893_2529 [Burkholderia pseudomallei TSV 31]